MCEENKILIIVFLFLMSVYFIGYVFLQWLLHKKYKFPTCIPPPFFEYHDFSVSPLSEPFYRHTDYPCELVPLIKNGNSTLIDKNVKNVSDRTKEDLRQEFRIVDNVNQSIFDKKVVFQRQVPVNENNTYVQALSKDSKELLPEVQVIIQKEKCISQKQKNSQPAEELNWAYESLTVPEFLSQCSSRLQYIDQKERQDKTDFSKKSENSQVREDICCGHMKPTTTTKEHSKRNPQLLNCKKKKVMRGEWIFKKWQKKKPHGVGDTCLKQLSLSCNKESISAPEEKQMQKNGTELKVLLKDNEDTLNYKNNTCNEEQKKQKELLIIKDSQQSNNEGQSSQEDDKEFSQNSQNFNQLVSEEQEIVQSEENKFEMVKNAQWNHIPMLHTDNEEFSKDHQLTEYMNLSKYKNDTQTEQEKSQILQDSQILDSQNTELLSLQKHFHSPSDIEKTQSSTAIVNLAEQNLYETHILWTNLECKPSTYINSELTEISKSIFDDNENKKLTSKSIEAVQCSCQSLFSKTNSNHKFQFPCSLKGTQDGICSSCQNTPSVNNFVPEKSNVSYNDLGWETEIPGENAGQKSVDSIKYLDQVLLSGIYRRQDGETLLMNCEREKKSMLTGPSSYQNNLSTNILVSNNLNQYCTSANKSSISKYNQVIQAPDIISQYDDTSLHQNTISQKNHPQEPVTFSSSIHISEKFPQPKQSYMSLNDPGLKQNQYPNLPKVIDNTKIDPDLGAAFEQLYPRSFSGIIPQQELMSKRLKFQSSNDSNNAETSLKSKLCVNTADKTFHESSSDKVNKKLNLVRNLQNENFISNDKPVDQTSLSGISQKQNLGLESFTHVRSDSQDKLRSTQNPQVVKYQKSRSVKHVFLLAEDVSAKLQEESNDQHSVEYEKKTINLNVLNNLPNLEQVACLTEDKKLLSASLAQKISQDQISNEWTCSHKQMKDRSKCCDDLTNFKPISRISKQERLLSKAPQVCKKQMFGNPNKCFSDNVQLNERGPSLKQVHWLPGYVVPSPVLSNVDSKKLDNSIVMKLIIDKDVPRNGILKSTHKSHRLSSSSELQIDNTHFNLSKVQDSHHRGVSFWHFSPYGHPEDRTTYRNEDYYNLLYTWNVNCPKSTYIYSLQNNRASTWDRDYLKNNFVPNKFLEISGNEIPPLDPANLESFFYKNTNPDNRQLAKNGPPSQCLEGAENNIAHELQRCSGFRKRSYLFHHDHFFPPLKDLERKEHFKWFHSLPHCKLRYPKYFDSDYYAWSHRKYQDHLANFWHQEKYWNDHAMPAHQERYVDHWSKYGYHDWYTGRFKGDYSRNKERYWDKWMVCRESDLAVYQKKPLGEYSKSEYGKRIFNDSLSKQTKGKHCDKHFVSQDTKTYVKVKPTPEMRESTLDYSRTTEHKDGQNVFTYRERQQADQYRHSENYWGEWPGDEYRQRYRDAFIISRNRKRYKEDQLRSYPSKAVCKNLERSMSYQEYWDREKSWHNCYIPRYRETYWYGLSPRRSSEKLQH